MEYKLNADELTQIYNAIVNEDILRDADGNHVSEKWVASKESFTIMKNGELKAFLLFERSTVRSIYLHMLWVKKDSRRNGYGKKLIRMILKTFNDGYTFFGYANPNGQKIMKSCGFSIGETPYKECILRKKEKPIKFKRCSDDDGLCKLFGTVFCIQESGTLACESSSYKQKLRNAIAGFQRELNV